MDLTMPEGPADMTTRGEEFFRTEGTYTSLGAPTPGGPVARWLVHEGQRIEKHRPDVRRAVLAARRRRGAVVARHAPSEEGQNTVASSGQLARKPTLVSIGSTAIGE
jgi:hypothetical protein